MGVENCDCWMVYCDECDELNDEPFDTENEAVRAVVKDGWKLTKSGWMICPTCQQLGLDTSDEN